MTLAPILSATLPIKLHLGMIVAAIIVGAVQLALPKGDPRHRAMGRLWVVLMTGANLSALLILDRPLPPNIGPISFLHLLVPFTLFFVWRGVRAARRGDIAGHRYGMIFLYVLGLGVPLVIALAQHGRILHRAFFS